MIMIALCNVYLSINSKTLYIYNYIYTLKNGWLIHVRTKMVTEILGFRALVMPPDGD